MVALLRSARIELRFFDYGGDLPLGLVAHADAQLVLIRKHAVAARRVMSAVFEEHRRARRRSEQEHAQRRPKQGLPEPELRPLLPGLFLPLRVRGSLHARVLAVA